MQLPKALPVEHERQQPMALKVEQKRQVHENEVRVDEVGPEDPYSLLTAVRGSSGPVRG